MKRLVMGAALSLVVTSTLAPCGTAANQQQSFRMLARRFVNESEQRDPLFADGLGLHVYDATLDDYSEHGAHVRVRWLRHWRGRIDASMHESQLGPDDDADAHALRDAIDLELFEDATIKPRETDPTMYTGVIGNAVYSLTGRHYAPPDERFAFVAKRLALIPGIVAAAVANLQRPPRTTTLQAIDENDGNIAMYASLTTDDADASPATRAAVASALPGALASLRAFSTYLKAQLLPRSDGNPRVGARVYDRELVLANGTDEPRAQLVAEAQADFAQNRATMLQLAIPLDQKYFPKFTADESKPNAEDVVVRRVLDRLALDHPKRTTIFTTAAADVAGSETFLKAHPVVVLPRPSTLKVKPTPDFMAGFSGASLDPAGPFTPLAGSYYYIDKIPKAWSGARVTSYLRDFNNYEMRILSIHEAVPGHYVQFRYNAKVPSIVRRALANGAFVEGWAVYGEGMMLDAGYGNNDPRLRLFQLKWRLREEANTIVDAEFHTGDLSEGRCRDLLERQAYQERSEAETKWHRLLLSHDQLTSYYVGLSAIRHAQDAERARLGSTFDLARFNAALLAMGSLEPRYIQRLIANYEPASAAAPNRPSASATPATAGTPTITFPAPSDSPSPASPSPGSPSPTSSHSST
jgi:hypothetical protein